MMHEIRKRPLASNCTYPTCPQQLRKCPASKHEWSCVCTAMPRQGSATQDAWLPHILFVQGVHPPTFSTSQQRRPTSLSAPRHGVQRQECAHRTTCCTSAFRYAVLLGAPCCSYQRKSFARCQTTLSSVLAEPLGK